MDIQAVIFDMGGVIIRSFDEIPRIRLAKRLGWTYEQLINLIFDSPTARQATLGEITEEEHWETLRKQLEYSTENMQNFRKEFWSGDGADRELLDFIGGLRPKYRTGLLSNAWSGARRALTDQYHALDVFDVSVFSAEVGMAKPDPRFYQWMLNHLAVQPGEAIFVDDFPANVEAAVGLGIHGIQFTSSKQAQRDVIALLNGQT